MFDVLIRNGLIVDGTGRPGYRGDVGVADSRVAKIGDLSDVMARTIIEAGGLVVCPGFIDIHNHSDFTLLVNPRAESMVRQGVTTIVTGQCGHGCAPVRDRALIVLNLLGYSPGWGVEITWRSFGEYLQRLQHGGLGINVLPFVGHGAIRLAVMGFEERAATRTEITAMGDLLTQALEEGAAGLSWGLEYSPGRFVDPAEMDALSRVVARAGRLYAIHVRDRAGSLVCATQEAVSVAERAGLPIQLSHFAPRPYAPTGAFEVALQRLELAASRGVRVGLDVMPRTWGLSNIAALLPPWICADDAPTVLERLRQPGVRQAARDYWAEQGSYVLRSGGPERVVVTYAPNNPDVVGLNFIQIAEMRETTMADAACDILIAEGENLYNALVRHVFATSQDLDHLLAQANCAVASDGLASAPYGPLAELRTTRDSYGYAAHFLAEYVRHRAVLTLEEAVRRMTALPSQLCDLKGRGRLVEGGAADVVVLDLARVRDQTTDSDPNAYPEGVAWVLVNGSVVVQAGQHTGCLAGRFL